MDHHIIPTLFFLLVVSLPPSSPSPTALADEDALLMFKKSIESADRNEILSNWNRYTDPCGWTGVFCDQGRVTGLNLSSYGLIGSLSFYPLLFLDMLSSLNLSSNSFYINTTNLRQLPKSLEQLDLASVGLTGFVPDEFPSLYPNLVLLNLSHNNLTGSLPHDLLKYSPNLQFIDLSCNNLATNISSLIFDESSCSNLLFFDLSMNRIGGSVPDSLSNCANLRTLNLSSNSIVGEIPSKIGELWRLEKLDISNNNISGSLPTSLLSCSSLQILDLANNNISGSFPGNFFDNLVSLEYLFLSNNFISGELPGSISAAKKLKIVDLSSNKLSGSLPADFCSEDTSLEELRLPDNSIAGEIPAGLSSCTNLKTIDLSINYLSGPILPEFGKLRNLEHLMLWFNGIRGRIPPELGNCLRLKTLILNNNFLSGEIPPELFNCGELEWISLTSNRISGKIGPEFGRLSRLAVLQLANNSLSGEIPKELSNCSSMLWLDLNSNRLSGRIPGRLGRQFGAEAVAGILSGNTLAFVRNVGNSCNGVGGLLEFAGIRPERLLSVPTLKSCDFTRLYSGAALSDWTHYQTLEYLDLSYNSLSGEIPHEFGDMIVLQVLDLAHNKLTGEIPDSIGRLRNLGVFDASHNQINGRIPESFSNLSFLVQIDLSNNRLSGEIPARGQLSTLPASQYANNPGLCGVPLSPCEAKPTSNGGTGGGDDGGGRSSSTTTAAAWANSIVLGVLASVAFICVVVVWAIIARAKSKEAAEQRMLSSLHGGSSATTWKISKEREPLSINVATFQRQLRRLKFSQLIEATDGFSAAALVGSGGFGEVFKATLKDGSCVAVKKLVHLSYQGDREFVAEMETLGKIKHKNLVPLLGYCKVGEERLLVYEYMQNGSLEDMLHYKEEEQREVAHVCLNWEQRKRILRGAARGLCFLHHNCIPHIIHRDMKSSNVLIDGDMEARVADFGMARLISALDTHLSVTSLAGTPGYVPPEYYQSFRCTAKGDVYSFGVVMLEVITGKRPTDKEDFGDTNLVGWAKAKVAAGLQREVVDAKLVAAVAGESEEEEIMRLLEIALQCVDDFPGHRPNMFQVVAKLRELRGTSKYIPNL